jgi:hypothetical protein
MVLVPADRSVWLSRVRNLCAGYGPGFRFWSRGAGQLHAREVWRTLDGIIRATASASPREVPVSQPLCVLGVSDAEDSAVACEGLDVLNDFTRVKSRGMWLVLAPNDRSVWQSRIRNLCVGYGLGFRFWSRGSGQLHAREVLWNLDGISLATVSATRWRVPVVRRIASALCAGRV